jgi:hypothetical protein
MPLLKRVFSKTFVKKETLNGWATQGGKYREVAERTDGGFKLVITLNTLLFMFLKL